jgi:Flp pilus assembly protein CpaB
VLVATRDLTAGTVVQAGDVTMSERDSTILAADATTSATAAVGRSLVSSVRAGEVLRSRDVLDSPLLQSLGAGIVAAPVRVADGGATALLRAGDVIDLIAAGTTGDGTSVTATVVASDVRVLVVPIRSGGSGGGLFASSGDVTGSDGQLVVLGTTKAEALDIARASLRGRLSFTVRSQ